MSNEKEIRAQAEEFTDALNYRHFEKAKTILEKGFPVDLKIEGQEMTFLQQILNVSHLADGREEFITLMIDAGADLSPVYEETGNSFLHNAARYGLVDIVEQLVKRGIDKTIKNKNGEMPLYHAKDLATGKKLLDLGVGSINDVDQFGDGVLHAAQMDDPDPEWFGFLAEKADINHQNKNGATPLNNLFQKDFIYDYEKREKVAMLFIKNGADVNLANEKGFSPLMRLTKSQRFSPALLEAFISAGVKLDAATSKGFYPVHFAARYRTSYLKRFIELGADVNVTTKLGTTPLHYAAINNNYESVEILVSKVKDINLQDGKGKTALNYAIENEHDEVQALLEKHGAKAASEEQQDAVKNKINSLKTAIEQKNFDEVKYYYEAEKKSGELNLNASGMLAVSVGALDIVKYLTDKGFDIQHRDEEGYTPLHSAVFYGHFDISEFLIEKGADVNAKSTEEERSVYILLTESNPKTADLLEKSGVIISEIDRAGVVNESMDRANVKMARYFIEKGFPLNKDILEDKDYLIRRIQAQDTESYDLLLEQGLDIETMLPLYGKTVTILHLAVRIGADDLALHLLAKGANANAKDSSGDYVVEEAFQGNKIKLLKELYKRGASLEVEMGFHERPPLLYAIESNAEDAAEYIISLGPDVNLVDRSGNAALHLAAGKGYLELIKQLIEAGASVHKLNDERMAPWDVARYHEHKKAMELLGKYESDYKTPNKHEVLMNK